MYSVYCTKGIISLGTVPRKGAIRCEKYAGGPWCSAGGLFRVRFEKVRLGPAKVRKVRLEPQKGARKCDRSANFVAHFWHLFFGTFATFSDFPPASEKFERNVPKGSSGMFRRNIPDCAKSHYSGT